MGLYLDASVIVSLFISDAFSDRAESEAFGADQELFVSDWAVLEVSSVVRKRARIGAISQEEALTLLADFDLWRAQSTTVANVQAADIAAANILVRRLDVVLRGPDAIHIAIVQRLGAHLLTFDKGMEKVAASIGLRLTT